MRTVNWPRSLRQPYFLETINLDANLFYELINAISVYTTSSNLFLSLFYFAKFNFKNTSKISMAIYQDFREIFVMNNFTEKHSLTKKSIYQQLLSV